VLFESPGPMHQMAARHTIHTKPRKKYASSSFAVGTNKYVHVGTEDTARSCEFEKKCVYEKRSTKENCANEKRSTTVS